MGSFCERKEEEGPKFCSLLEAIFEPKIVLGKDRTKRCEQKKKEGSLQHLSLQKDEVIL